MEKKSKSITTRDKRKLFLKFLEEKGIPPEVLSELDVEKFIGLYIQKKESYQLFPEPDLLKQYEKLRKGFVDTIINSITKRTELAIEVARHDMAIEKTQVEQDGEYLKYKNAKTKRSQWFAFIIALAGIGGAILCVFYQLELLGAALVGFPLASIIASFLGSRISKDKE